MGMVSRDGVRAPVPWLVVDAAGMSGWGWRGGDGQGSEREGR